MADASFLIENPWKVAAICYACLVACLIAFIATGSLIVSVFGLARKDTYGLFVRLLVGLVGTTVFYALVRSGGQTALVPIVVFGLATYWVARKGTDFDNLGSNQWISKGQLGLLLGYSAITFFLFLTLLLNVQTGELRFLGAGESAQFIDFPFTVRAGQLLNFCGIESISTNFFDASQLRPTPYHWLEIWFGALIYEVFPFNGEVLWSCVVNPALFTTLLIGVAGLLERIVSRKPLAFIGALLVFFVSGFGLLYPSEIPFFSATVRAESLLETPKYAIAYLFAVPVVEGLYNDRKKLLPYLFVLFGLSYLPIIPVGSIMAFAALMLYVWSVKEDKKKGLTAIITWSVFYLILAAWFYTYYSNSQISYTAGSGASTGVLKTFDPVLSTKVFGHMIIQIFITNLPYLLVIVGLIIVSNGAGSFKSWCLKNANSLFLLVVFYPVSVLGYVMIYGMTNSVQVWTVSYQSLHYIVLVCLLINALNQNKWTPRVIAGLVIAFVLALNFNVDLGAGNEVKREQLTKIQEFIGSDDSLETKFVYIGDARYGNDGAGGLFDLVTDIFYPSRELGIVTSPYANASLSVFEVPLSTDPKAKAKQQRILSNGPFYQFVGKQTDVEQLTPEKIAKFKVEFIKAFHVRFLILPNDQQLSEELQPLVGDFIEVRDGKVYELF